MVLSSRMEFRFYENGQFVHNRINRNIGKDLTRIVSGFCRFTGRRRLLGLLAAIIHGEIDALSTCPAPLARYPRRAPSRTHFAGSPAVIDVSAGVAVRAFIVRLAGALWCTSPAPFPRRPRLRESSGSGPANGDLEAGIAIEHGTIAHRRSVRDSPRAVAVGRRRSKEQRIPMKWRPALCVCWRWLFAKKWK